MQDHAEIAALYALAELGHLGMPAAVVAEPERDARTLDGRDGLVGFRLRQRERLLAEHVLAAARGGDDLLRVQRVRRREDDRVDAGIFDHFFEAREKP